MVPKSLPPRTHAFFASDGRLLRVAEREDGFHLEANAGRLDDGRESFRRYASTAGRCPVATIDRYDRRFILALNDMAAASLKLSEVTTSGEVAGIYLRTMLRRQGDLESAVFRAMQRAGIKPVIGSCWGCRAAGRAEGYEEGLRAAGVVP